MDFNEMAADSNFTSAELEEFAESKYMEYIAFCVGNDIPFDKVITKHQFLDGGVMAFMAQNVIEQSDHMAVVAAAAIADLYGDSVDALADKIREKMAEKMEEE